MDRDVYSAYVKILKAELVPAMGCTEPIAIAYCAAEAKKVLGTMPEWVKVDCSGNIIKNVKGVTVPNSGGLKGIAAAALLGIVAGDPDKRLEVISAVTDAQRAQMRELLKREGYFECGLIEGSENLHIIVSVRAGEHTALVEIKTDHTNITRIEKDGQNVFLEVNAQNAEADGDELARLKELLNVKDILKFASEADLDEVREPLELQIRDNTRIASEGLTNDYGVRVGKTLIKNYGDKDVLIRARAYAAAGSDARMSGCAMPVVINSGSGNQGITVTMPVVEFARDMNADHDKLLRALIVSNLIAIHQKRYLGNLSAYCGATSAACGAACGVAWLYGGGYDEIAKTITNTIANIGGMVCDGAKPSCAAKIASAVDAALMGFQLQQNGGVFGDGEGLVKSDVEKTISAVGKMGHDGMRATDVEILNIMIDKE